MVGFYIPFECKANFILSSTHLMSTSNRTSASLFGGNQYVKNTKSTAFLLDSIGSRIRPVKIF